MIACMAAGGAAVVAYILAPLLRHKLGDSRFMGLLKQIRVAWNAAAGVFRHVQSEKKEEENETNESN